MKRTPLPRTGRLRRSPIQARNAARLRRLEARNFGAHARWIRGLPCCVCGAPPRSVAAHAKARGMGGCGGDRRHLLPMCVADHEAYDAHRGMTQDEALALAATYWQRSPHNDDTGQEAA